MYCRECGQKLANEKSVICVRCGTSKGNGNNYCFECGEAVNNKDARVCLKCGVELKIGNTLSNQFKSSSNQLGKGNNKMVAGLLAIFLGATGVHRFYLGYKEIGFIQLGIFLVALFLLDVAYLACLVWAVIDAVQIFTGRLNNANSNRACQRTFKFCKGSDPCVKLPGTSELCRLLIYVVFLCLRKILICKNIHR